MIGWTLWFGGILLRALPVFASTPDHVQMASQAVREHRQHQTIHYFSQRIDDQTAPRSHRAAAFAGRCAAHYKQSLATRDRVRARLALEDCHAALNLQSDYQRAYRLRGTTHLTLGQLEQALADLNVAVALDPKDYLSLQNRGLTHTNLNRWDEALNDFNAAIEIRPAHPWSYYGRGQLWFMKRRHQQAVADFSTFMTLKEGHDPVYVHRGKSWMLAARYTEAKRDFNVVLARQPDHHDARAYLGLTLFLQGEYAQAEQALRTAIQHAPHNMENRVWLFLALAWQRQPGDEAFAGDVAPRDPGRWPGVLSALLLDQIHPDEALDVVRQTSDPEQRRQQENFVLFLLGEQALLHNLPDEAMHWLQQIRAGRRGTPTVLHAAQRELRKLLGGRAKAASVPPFGAVATTQRLSPKTQPVAKPAGNLPELPKEPAHNPLLAALIAAPSSFEPTQNPASTVPAPTRRIERHPGATPSAFATHREEKARIVERTTATRESESKPEPLSPMRVVSLGRDKTDVIEPDSIDGDARFVPKHPQEAPEPAVAPVTSPEPNHAADAAIAARFGLTREAISEINLMASRKAWRRTHAKGQFAFQIGAFRDSTHADRALADASRLKLPVYIQEVSIDRSLHIRVWVGPFRTSKQAHAARQNMLATSDNTPRPVIQFK